jgi:hypothetical protein
MTWVEHTDPRTAHRCPVPHEASLGSPAGEHGDLWRCDDCGTLWRVGYACDICDRHRDDSPHFGGHTIGLEWRPATWWQRIRRWRSGRA